MICVQADNRQSDACGDAITNLLSKVVGFLPLLLDPTRFWPPLPIAVSGGLVAATALALVHGPAAHGLLVRRP